MPFNGNPPARQEARQGFINVCLYSHAGRVSSQMYRYADDLLLYILDALSSLLDLLDTLEHMPLQVVR